MWKAKLGKCSIVNGRTQGVGNVIAENIEVAFWKLPKKMQGMVDLSE